MRRRLRKKLHRRFLNTICGWVLTFDDELRLQLLNCEPGTPFLIESGEYPAIKRLIRGKRICYTVALARKVATETAVVAYWADEFPSVRDKAVIFSVNDFDCE